METYSITIRNEKIWRFYNEHPNLDFENINLLFIDIMTKLQDANSSITSNSIVQITEHMKNMQMQIKTINDNFDRMQEDTAKEFTYRLSQFKREYIEDIKLILNNNVSEKVAPLIKEQNSIILDKTHLLINDILSKNKDENVIKHINETMNVLNSSIVEETNKLMSNNINKKTFDDFISNIESKFTSTLQNSHNIFSSSEKRLDTSIRDIKLSTENQLNYLKDILSKNKDENVIKHINETMNVLNSSIVEETNKLMSNNINKKTFDDFISNIESKFTSTLQNSHNIFSSSEKRLDTSIRDIKLSTENQLNYLKDISTSNHQTNSALNHNVSELLKKMEISSCKGKVSENIVFNILQNLYPSGQIDSVGTQKETGDIILRRLNKPTILIENKNWERNVVQEEVKKFIHDIEQQNCCGLFLSQNCGVATKENFEINIHNNNVLVYVHEVNNDAEKIKLAISIIDHFKSKLDELDSNDEIDTISKELLEEINREYQALCSQKIIMSKLIKETNAKLLKQLDEFNIPTLQDYLSKRFAFSTTKYTCEYCEYPAKNMQSLSAHHRGCYAKKNHQTQPTENKIDNVDIEVPTEIKLKVKQVKTKGLAS